ncbi:HNH endonuclease [Verrucomicrobiaceae bacterium 5K15]|uniref:HNH endonuclease n=1 Tax=Oceaniferula flava TaxID=2800421 RepID=A0AAE2SAE5_9BACT|nr:HNH endonuclease [Oceaniferula flavus]MBK1853984.1 HNH endonuclease [Oceaniferula flavus]MBM1135290.1 HNH endonuclease [Oceaniferula flavus]
MSYLHKNTVLVLNRNWQAISVTTPAHAYGQMATDAATGLDIQHLDWMVPVDWNTWLSLPVRETDLSIGTARGPLRVPTVIVLSRYADVPMHRPNFSARTLWLRDGGRCQYTGRLLRKDEGNIDHVIPQSRGGETSWENCVLSCRKINTRKADRTPAEAGLRLLRRPETPRAVPVTLTLHNQHNIEDWKVFLPNNDN